MDFYIEKANSCQRKEFLNILRYWNMHHIPSVEMEDFNFECYYVAKVENKIVGLSGYKILNKEQGKTTLLVVLPEYLGSGIGKALQLKRLEVMYKKGIKSVITNSDRKETIVWYKKHFEYKEIGKIKKLISFGENNVDYWTTLEMNLDEYMKAKDKKEKFKEEYKKENESYPIRPYQPLIINVALTGIVPNKSLNKYVPVSIEEIVNDAILVHDLGASIVHIHARDKDGVMTNDARYYEEIISKIKKERPELICCATTSGRNGQSIEERSEVLDITGLGKPDMASLTLGSLNFISGVSINDIDTVTELAFKMKEKNIKPELEIFDAGMINLAKYLERYEILNGIKYFNILLGNLNTASGTIKDLAHIYTSLPKNSIWSAGGLGQFQLPINIASIVAGGNVRVGIEDNIYYDNEKKILASNKQLVQRLVNITEQLGREIAKPSNVKEKLGLKINE